MYYAMLKLAVSFLWFLYAVQCLSVDGKRAYHDISSGQGLYKSTDKINILNSNDFGERVHDSQTAWLVEFYNSWCGHCIQYAPKWKAFGIDVSAWKRLVKIGAVDCSNEINNDLCREYEIMSYPSLRYFSPQTPRGNYGNVFRREYTVDKLRHALAKKLIEQAKNTSVTEEWPSLNVYSQQNVFDVWQNVPKSTSVAAFFVELTPKEDSSDDDKLAGVEFILDMSLIPEILATRVQQDSAPAQQLNLSQVPGVGIIKRDNDIIPFVQDSREERLKAVANFLVLNGFSISILDSSQEEPGDTADVIHVIKEEWNRGDQEDVVYQIDLESALQFSLEKDITLKDLKLEGERLEALRNYIQVLTKYFPFDLKGRGFLEKLNTSVFERESLSPVEFKNLVTSLSNTHNPYLMKTSTPAWIGCQSKQAGLRRYPCGLWTMFHTLTVAAANNSNSENKPKEVLHAMRGYIKHFFSCTNCAENFAKEIANLDEVVNSLNESILYLWETHNHVNRRLHQYPGNITEDPEHPKIQFPSQARCPTCHISSDNWNKTAVLLYLKNMYSKISYKAISDFSAASLVQLKGDSETGPLVIDTRYFNIFDISLCVMLYFVSAMILILVALKFFMKKSHKRKVFISDLLRRA